MLWHDWSLWAQHGSATVPMMTLLSMSNLTKEKEKGEREGKKKNLSKQDLKNKAEFISTWYAATELSRGSTMPQTPKTPGPTAALHHFQHCSHRQENWGSNMARHCQPLTPDSESCSELSPGLAKPRGHLYRPKWSSKLPALHIVSTFCTLFLL